MGKKIFFIASEAAEGLRKKKKKKTLAIRDAPRTKAERARQCRKLRKCDISEDLKIIKKRKEHVKERKGNVKRSIRGGKQ